MRGNMWEGGDWSVHFIPTIRYEKFILKIKIMRQGEDHGEKRDG